MQGQHVYDDEIHGFCPYCKPEDITHEKIVLNLVPTKFGKYSVTKEIGSGGGSRVYLVGFGDQNYALKLYDKISNEKINSVKSRFNSEISIIKELDHENVIRLYDFGFEFIDGFDRPYIVMEYVDGASLADKVDKSGLFTPEKYLPILDDICKAVDFLHENNVLHCDISPSNILIGSDGKLKITDFGISRMIPKIEKTVVVFTDQPGTLDFSAPEILTESVVTKYSDIYALSMMSYYLLSGKLPSNARTPYMRSNDFVSGKLIDLYERNPAVSHSVSSVIMKGLSVKPRDRYKNAKDFFNAFYLSLENANSLINNEPAQQRADNKIDVYRYIWVPIIIAILGVVGTIISSLPK